MTEHLLPGQSNWLHTRLLLRRGELERQLGLHQQTEGRIEHAQDLLAEDSGDANAHDADREVDQALAELARQELADIDEALARMRSGHYGRCVSCGEAIPFERLRSAPQTRHCLNCEEMGEVARGERYASL